MDRIKEMMNQLAELSDEQVTQLQEEIIAEFETVESEEPSSQTVDAMTSLADMLDAVRSEFKQREAAAEELAQRAADAAARVKGEDVEGEDAPSDDSEEESDSKSEAAMYGDKEEKAEKPESKDEEEDDSKEEAAMDEKKEMKEEDEKSDSEAPAESDEDEEEDMKEKKEMSEASTEAKETAELSTDEVSEEATEAADETVTASAEEEAVAEPKEELSSEEDEAVAEDEAEATSDEEVAEDEESEGEASVEEKKVVEAAVETETVEEASTETPVEAELSSDEENTETITSSDAELSAEETTENMEAPVTAAAENAENLDIEVPEGRRMESKESYAPVAITAGADIPGYTAGSSLDDMDAVAEAMAKRLHTLRRVNGGDGEQHIVASLTTSFPEERTLSTDAEENWEKINNVVSPEAITAAGGHVAPFEARYDIFAMGSSARPVRDSLPRFQADRGGIRFVTPPALVDHVDAVGVWTAANDAAETPSPSTKQSLTVSAAAENTVATDAVTLQMQFGNLATRAYPELISRHNELGLIQHAREAEAQILTRIGAESTAVTSTSLIGVGRDYLVQLGRAASAYRARHRLEPDAPLRVILPSWVRDAMAADLALSMPGDSLLDAYGEIDGLMASRNINASYTLDSGMTAAQNSGALNEFADTFVWYMFAEGTFLFLDGGTLDLGIIRDSSLVGTNDYKMFIETFEGVAKVGIESLAVTSTIQVNGAAAALRDTLGGVASSTIEY